MRRVANSTTPVVDDDGKEVEAEDTRLAGSSEGKGGSEGRRRCVEARGGVEGRRRCVEVRGGVEGRRRRVDRKPRSPGIRRGRGRLGLGGLHARPLAQAQAHAEGGAGGGGRWRGGRLGLAWGAAARRGVGAVWQSRLN